MPANEWSLNGEYLESCTCKGACPCLHMAAPTEGSCAGLVAWHIDDGRYGDVPLDGLNIVVALDSPGAMADGNWKVVLYIDDAADNEQTQALGEIFGGKAGGHPAVLASFIGEVRGVEQVPIQYRNNDGKVQLQIGDQAGATVHANEGPGGERVTLHNHPFAVAPGVAAVLATSETLRHHAHGIDVEVGNRTAAYSPFSYAGP